MIVISAFYLYSTYLDKFMQATSWFSAKIGLAPV